MIVAPIIHTRTFSCDFNSEFLVRPDSFLDSDIKWARKNVLGATKSIDGLVGVRWLIADNEKYRMAGVVGFLKDICLKCQLSDENKRKSEELFCDDKGRMVYAFIGIVIDKRKSVDYGMVSYEYLWNLYFEKIYDIWNRTYQEIVLEKFVDIKFDTISTEMEMSPTIIGLKELFEVNPVTDYNLFSSLLCNKNKDNFSFCSNIQDFNLIKQSNFSIMTTSRNIIKRLERENPTTVRLVENEKLSKIENVIDRNEQSNMLENKKKSFLIFGSVLIILLMIILILVLI